MSSLKSTIRCREITPADLEAVADLLTRGFSGRRRGYWLEGLRRQAAREFPAGYPRLGYMLDHDGTPVGALLLIYSERKSQAQPQIWCNLSSWYVAPAFRNYAPMLTKIAQRLGHVSYVNISAARTTWPIIEAQGFRAYCKGLFLSVPALSHTERRARVEIVSGDSAMIDGLPADEAALLLRHARYRCLSIVVRSERGAIPFVLQPARMRRGLIPLPAMQLVYCRDVADYAACAGAIGWFLAKRAKIAVLIDANGPLLGLVGLYTERRGRKYFKGPRRPRLGDLSDTELVVYGP